MKDFVMSIVFRYVLLFIQVYAFYVILHGHLSPGGGFAGGILLGLGMVLYVLIFGVQIGSKRLPQHLAIILIGIGGAFEGAKFFLPHGERSTDPGGLFSVGLISVMSVAIGLLVASALLTMFYLLVEEESS
jgi:multicomponent Na+:H+ antiporter subunit B